ncbi:hypothetical protein [Chryseobacterium lactis]|uniref:hypothetical protein n=1 Tax=Chryseobacterium lactis TaxID=1241981 RepID=UPI00162755E1|nr:hypothetical protein [Chryseobacterium lactis]
MSFYFTIGSEKKITYRQLSDKLKSDNIEFSYAENIDEFIDEYNCKAFIKDKSTRGVNLNYREQEYSIGLNIVSSETDFEIALNITEAISELTQSPILPEDEENPIDLITFKNNYNSKWIEQEKYGGISIFIDKIGNDGEILEIGCCYMNYKVGPNIHKKLDTRTEKSYYDGLVSHISKTQFWDREKYQIPNIIQTTNRETGEKKNIIILYQNGKQFLSNADVVVISHEESRIEIPYEKIKLLASEKFHLVDEVQYLVDELTDEEYKKIYLKAEEISTLKETESIAGLNSALGAQKKWWEFWK